MTYRPALLVLLACAHFLAPFAQLVTAWFVFGLPPGPYLEHLIALGPRAWFESFALFPIAGFALWRMRPWSLPVFGISLALGLLRHWLNYRDFPSYVSPAHLAIVFVLSAGMASYLLRRGVKAPFYDSRLRWWEGQPRYAVQAHCQLDQVRGEVADISLGGALVVIKSQALSDDLRERDRQLSFTAELLGDSVVWGARSVHLRGGANEDRDFRLGIAFEPLGWWARIRQRRILRALMRTGRPLQRGEAISFFRRLRDELTEIFQDFHRKLANR